MADFIQQAIPPSHKGLLHKHLGIPQGQTIPAATLNKAAHSPNPTIEHEALLAKTLKKMHHGA